MLPLSLSAHSRGEAAEPRAPVEWTRMRLGVPAIAVSFVFSLIFKSFTLPAGPLDQWYRRNPLPTADRLSGVAYGNNTFVTVGFGGAIASSADGTNWVSQTSGTPEAL